MKTRLKAHAPWATPLMALLLTMGCASTGQPAPADLRPQALSDVQLTAPARGQRPTVALAPGGGGLRGFAHVGALRALEEAGMHPDIVVGTSASSVVGAAYASGMSVEKIMPNLVASNLPTDR